MEKFVKQAIVITSIFEPTPAVKKFAALGNYQLFVAGDKKTPAGWHYPGVQFLSYQQQKNAPYALAKILPANHYCRKMLGYLEAIGWGAEIIIDTDDDNLPYDGYGFPPGNGTYDTLPPGMGFVNIYRAFTNQNIWPRGLPLSLINSNAPLPGYVAMKNRIGIWQGLANNDPDVDAIYRLTSDKPCFFDARSPLVLAVNTICPFNSQNTLFVKELFPLLYLPAFVTFRFTDILRGLVAQPIMWAHGFKLGFTEPTVEQLRNPHDYFKDFESELPMYTQGHLVPQIIAPHISSAQTVSNNLLAAYLALQEAGIVTQEEISVLEAWLQDLKQLTA